MKTFFKEHIVISLIWNAPITFVVGIFLNQLKLESMFYWVTLILIYWTFVLISIKVWHKEEQFDKLERRVKELEKKLCQE